MESISQRERIMIMLAIMSAMLFAALNQTIVGTALPRIVSQLGGMNYFNWVFTIYMLSTSVTAILVGRLSDMYGRKRFILIGIFIFMIGSLLSGMSTHIIQLILFRAIQGTGAGMIMSTAFAAVGDLFSPRERGRWQGLMSSVFGIASLIGPTLGGLIVDHAQWRWVFWVFLPFGFIAFYFIWRLFPTPKKKPKAAIDYWGSLLITFTLVPLLLAFSWAGKQYAWSSWQILLLFSTSLLALLFFLLVENKAINPVLPLSLFRIRIFTISNVIGFIIGAGMFGATIYIPFYIQGVLGKSATTSGFLMMPMTLSMVLASTLAGNLITRTGKYKMLAFIGLAIMSIGMYSLAQMGIQTASWVLVMNMLVAGMGLGMAFPIFVLTVQNAVSPQLMGVGTASAQLFRQLGGTIGVSAFGTILSYRMGTEIASRVSTLSIDIHEWSLPNGEQLQLDNPQVLMNPEQLTLLQQGLPNTEREQLLSWIEMIRETFSVSLSQVFLTGSLLIAGAFLLTFALQEIPLRTKREEHLQVADGEEQRS